MKTYFKLMLALYGLCLAVGMVCRVLLKQNYIDIDTGFYLGGVALVLVFNICLAAAPVIMFVSNRLKKADDDYAVYSRGRLASVFALAAGVSILLLAVIGSPESQLQQGYSPAFYEMRGYITRILGFLAGAAFLYLGFVGLTDKRPLGGILIIPAVWQVVVLITRYNSYTTVTAISDHLLLVLFMVFSSLFLLGHARTLSNQMRKDGRNYAIPAGLCLSLCGFFLVIPNYVYVFTHVSPGIIRMMGFVRAYSTSMPTGLLGWAESFYILVMSVYTLSFTLGLIRSIKRV